ncbi:MAG: hypothetical protein ACKVOM_14130, partial [Ferruginibacter sp.]
MKQAAKNQLLLLTLYFLLLSSTMISCHHNENEAEKNELSEKHNEYDDPDKAAAFEIMRTKDPALGYVPTDRLLLAKEYAEESKSIAQRTMSAYGNWV